MGTRTNSVLIFTLLLQFCGAVIPSENAGKTNNKTGPELVLVYKRNGLTKLYMDNDLGAGPVKSERAYLNISIEDNHDAGEDGNEIFTIILKGSRYATISQADSTFQPTASFDSRGLFYFHQVGDYVFNLRTYPANESLVAFGPGPAYNFAIQSRFPGETPAEFSVIPYVLNVSEIYNYERENIRRAGELIHELNNVNKTESYANLLTLMNLNGHLQGAEIFQVGGLIQLDIGMSQFPAWIPEQVRLLSSGNNSLQLFCVRNYTYIIPLKYNIASQNHLDIQPFTFSYSYDRDQWALTYANQHQIYVTYQNPPYPLVEELSPTKRFTLSLNLTTDLSSFTMYSYYYVDNYRRIISRRLSSAAFGFEMDTFPTPADGSEFYVEEYK